MDPASTTIIRLLLAAHLFALAAASQNKTSTGFAYGIGAGAGIGGLLFLILGLLWLRRRHHKKVANGELDMTGFCDCKECSGCTKRKGGGNKSAACAACRHVCMK
jgi:hypothetical protein